MYQFLFWGVIAGDYFIPYKIYLWWADGTSWYCMADGSWGLHRQFENVKIGVHLFVGLLNQLSQNGDAGQLTYVKDRHRINELLQACKPDPVLCLLRQAQDDKVVIIYLSRQLPGGINLPTHQHWTSRPYPELTGTLTYMAFQHARFTRPVNYLTRP